jgi:arylsulfatase A-like enzyme
MRSPISRRVFIAGSAAVGLSGQADAGPRNFVFITIDDLLSVVHHRERYGINIKTPNLNRLMSRSLTFSNAFCTTPLCNPSRTSIVSGLNPFKTGVHDNETLWWNHVDLWSTFPGLFRQAGWRCYMYGKITHFAPTVWDTSGICQVVSKDREHRDRVNVDAAISHIERLKSGPFLLMVGLHNPHWPFESPARFYEDYPIGSIEPLDWSGDPPPNPQIAQLFRDHHQRLEDSGEVDDYIQGYLANVAEADFHLGRLLSAIDDSGLRPTIILTSDHGYHLGEHDTLGKSTLWDEACRAPLVISMPAGPRGVRYHDPVSLLDIAPTFLRLAGLPVPDGLDGRSLTPLLADPTVRRESGALSCIVDALGESISLRSRFRLTRYFDGSFELYDQKLDPLSTNNLADDPGHAGVRAAMTTRLNAALARWKS